MSDKRFKHIGDPFDNLAEECAEVIQVLMKIRRFGMFNHHPDKPKYYNNKMALLDEMQDVQVRIDEVKKMLGEMHDPDSGTNVRLDQSESPVS